MYQEHSSSQDIVKNLFYRVYGWMTAGLLVTAGTALALARQPAWIDALVTRPFLGFLLLIIQLVVVVVFASMLAKLPYTVALGLFIFYAILSGATLSIIFSVYTRASIAQALLISAGMFGSISLWARVTHADLSKMGSILYMALWGMILALVVNIFWQNSLFNFMISAAGVVLFSALVAYDTSMIKRYATDMTHARSKEYAKVGLFGAFQLYLDFINLFLNLLNITGRRRQ